MSDRGSSGGALPPAPAGGFPTEAVAQRTTTDASDAEASDDDFAQYDFASPPEGYHPQAEVLQEIQRASGQGADDAADAEAPAAPAAAAAAAAALPPLPPQQQGESSPSPSPPTGKPALVLETEDSVIALDEGEDSSSGAPAAAAAATASPSTQQRPPLTTPSPAASPRSTLAASPVAGARASPVTSPSGMPARAPSRQNSTAGSRARYSFSYHGGSSQRDTDAAPEPLPEAVPEAASSSGSEGGEGEDDAAAEEEAAVVVQQQESGEIAAFYDSDDSDEDDVDIGKKPAQPDSDSESEDGAGGGGGGDGEEAYPVQEAKLRELYDAISVGDYVSVVLPFYSGAIARVTGKSRGRIGVDVLTGAEKGCSKGLLACHVERVPADEADERLRSRLETEAVLERVEVVREEVPLVEYPTILRDTAADDDAAAAGSDSEPVSASASEPASPPTHPSYGESYAGDFAVILRSGQLCEVQGRARGRVGLRVLHGPQKGQLKGLLPQHIEPVGAAEADLLMSRYEEEDEDEEEDEEEEEEEGPAAAAAAAAAEEEVVVAEEEGAERPCRGL
eukprot:Rhum_TRINITY_DN14497_c15_g1::Rhum_TRINITY_DN14497_c15_g1_i1::g.93223::m.93223